MATFRNQHDENLRNGAPIEKTDKARYRAWAGEVSSWLYSTEHIRVSYGMQHEGVDIETWKSTLRSPLKVSWNGFVSFSPIGCWPPWRPHRALAPMNKDAQGRQKVGRSESNWKCGLKCFNPTTALCWLLQPVGSLWLRGAQ